MAPEQAIGAVDQIDCRSDVFGLGAILAVILTGRPPFVADTAEATRQLAARGKLEECQARLDASGADPGLVALCKRCLAVDREGRPADAGEVAGVVAELRAAADERARLAELDRVRAEEERLRAVLRATEERKRRRLGLALAGLVLAGVVAGGGAWVWLSQQRQGAAREVEAALARASVLQEEGKLSDALAAARQAEGLLAAAGNPDGLRGRVRERLAEIELVAKLNEIRQGEPDSDDHLSTRHYAEPKYAKAFRDAGIDVDALGVDGAVREIEARPALRPYLLTALDDWVVPRRRGRPDDPESWRLLLEIARKLDPDPWRDQVRDAIARDDVAKLKELAASVEPRGQRLTTLNLLGEWLVLAGENQDAIALLRKAHAEYPGDFSVAYLLGTWLWRHGEPKTTEEMLRVQAVAVALSPERVNAWLLYSHGLEQAGRFADGVTACDRALRLRPENGATYFFRAWLVGRQGDTDGCRADLVRARNLLRRQATAEPEGSYAWYVLGRALNYLGEMDAMIDAYRNAVRDPHNAWAHGNLGIRLLTLGQEEESRTWLEKAVAINPNASRIRVNLGGVRQRLGDRTGAIAEYRAAIQSEPWYPRPYLELAALLEQEGKKDEALSIQEQCVAFCWEILRYRTGDHDALVSLGRYYLKQGDLDRAAHYLRWAVNQCPLRFWGYQNLGSALYRFGLLDEAVEMDHRWARTPTEEAVELNNNLAFHLMEKGEPLAEAHEALRKALAHNPNSDVATLTLAEVYRAEGKFGESLDAYRRGHELHKNKALQKWKTADWVKEAERKVELDKVLPEVLAGKRKPASPFETTEYAHLCYYKGLHASAARLYADAFAADPKLAAQPWKADHRYLAARSAVLAAAGRGSEAPSLDEAGRARLRKQALEWLRADLALLQEEGKKETYRERLPVRARLNHWRTHDDLLPVRSDKGLAALAEGEREEWQRLWADVADLLDRLKPPPITD